MEDMMAKDSNATKLTGGNAVKAVSKKAITAKRFIFIMAAIIVSTLCFGTACDTRPDVIPPEDGSVIAPPIAVEPEPEPEPEPDPANAYPYYYDATREGRYAAYAEAHPEFAIEDVYWRVNCDLDNPPYETPQEIADPNDLLVLVNKYNNLPEGFAPQNLVSIGNTMMRQEAADALQIMIADAEAEGYTLWCQSGYRSYDLQTNLYTNYSARDGQEAADTYSARPGYSEHQTGLATDLNTITDAFGSTPEGLWANENCWKYGFIVRYTAENLDITLYKSEPWHLRYVGLEIAQKMRDEQIASYEEYWVKYIKYTPPAGASANDFASNAVG